MYVAFVVSVVVDFHRMKILIWLCGKFMGFALKLCRHKMCANIHGKWTVDVNGTYCEQSGKVHTMDLMLLTLFGVRAAGSIQIRSNRNATQKKNAQKGWQRKLADGYCGQRMSELASEEENERDCECGNLYLYMHIEVFQTNCAHRALTMSNRLECEGMRGRPRQSERRPRSREKKRKIKRQK